MDISNPNTLPINLVKETHGALLVKIDLLEFLPKTCGKIALRCDDGTTMPFFESIKLKLLKIILQQIY